MLSCLSRRFNSTLVQLKVKYVFPVLAGFGCFNSTLVQLKEYADRVTVEAAKLFQFYLSSIKSYK